MGLERDGENKEIMHESCDETRLCCLSKFWKSASSRGSEARLRYTYLLSPYHLYRFTYISSRLLNDWPLMKNKPVSATQRFSLPDSFCPFSSNCARSCPLLQSQLTIQCDPHNSTPKNFPPSYTHRKTTLNSRTLDARVICSKSHSHLPPSLAPTQFISPRFSKRISRLPERS